MRVYMQIAICWLNPPKTDKKHICLLICEIGGICKIVALLRNFRNPTQIYEGGDLP